MVHPIPPFIFKNTPFQKYFIFNLYKCELKYKFKLFFFGEQKSLTEKRKYSRLIFFEPWKVLFTSLELEHLYEQWENKS